MTSAEARTGRTASVTTAAVLHGRVDALAGELLTVVAAVPEHHLHDEWGDHPRTLAEQLGVLAQVGTLIADQLRDWGAGTRTVLGVSSSPSVDLDDAEQRAREAALPALRRDVEQAWAALSEAIAALEDRHLRATVTDMVRGREPLVTWLTAEVLREGRAHVDAIQAILGEIDALWPADEQSASGRIDEETDA